MGVSQAEGQREVGPTRVKARLGGGVGVVGVSCTLLSSLKGLPLNIPGHLLTIQKSIPNILESF